MSSPKCIGEGRLRSEGPRLGRRVLGVRVVHGWKRCRHCATTFRLNYCWRPIYHRVFRSAEATDAEAASISMTWPNELVSRGSDHHFAKYLRDGFFAYLRVASFDINDPVKENEAYYGKPSRGIYTIFDAGRSHRLMWRLDAHG